MNNLEQLIQAFQIQAPEIAPELMEQIVLKSYTLGRTDREEEIAQLAEQILDRTYPADNGEAGLAELLSHISSTNNNKEVWNYKNK